MMKKIMLWLLCAVLTLSIPLQAFAEKTNQITVQGGSAAREADGVRISKTITPYANGGNVENYFDIELKVSIDEQQLKSVSNYTTEIAMVLDISNTMNAQVAGSTKTRMDLVREGLKSFVTSIARENPNHVYLTLIVFNTHATRIVNEHLILSGDQDDNSFLQRTIASIKATSDGKNSESNYGASYNRFTNMEGGLQLAYNNLRTNAKDHQYVVLMSDGFPTTYNQFAGDQGEVSISGYNPYTTVERTLRRYAERYSLDSAAQVLESRANFKTGHVNYDYNKDYNSDYYGWRGYFADPLDQEVTPYGTSYSDWGAYYAQRLALHMKGYYKDKADRAPDGSYLIGKADPGNSNRINIFSMGVDLGVQTVDGYQNKSDASNIRDLMTTTDVNRFVFPPLFGPTVGTQYNHIIGSGSGSTTAGQNDMTYENWLGYVIAGGQDYARIYGNGNEHVKAYYSLNNGTNVSAPYRQIWESIETISYQRIIDTMIASDPMGQGVEFIGFYNREGQLSGRSLSGHSGVGAEDTASVSAQNNVDTISWQLAHSGYTESTSGNVTTRTYSIKYRVRLKNELASFAENTPVDTNGATTLTYRVDSTGDVSNQRTLEFPMPAVKGWLGELSFTKQDSQTNAAIPGVEFTLTHKWNCSVCARGKGSRVSIGRMVETSNDSGLVQFTGIPSGHQYILTETVPHGYGAFTEDPSWPVEVHFDETTIAGQTSSGFVIPNTPQHNMIHVQFAAVKNLLNADGFDAGKFTFDLALSKPDGSATNLVSFEETPGTPPDRANPVTSWTLANPSSSESEGSTADILFPLVHVFEPDTYRLTIREKTGSDGSLIRYDSSVYAIDFTAERYNVSQTDNSKFDMHITRIVLFKNGTEIKRMENEDGLSHADHGLINDLLVFENVHQTAPMQLTKLDRDTAEPIEGVVFTLIHQCEESCGYVINDLSAASDANGLVVFDKIPVEHQYLLQETRPVGYDTEESAVISVWADGSITSGEYRVTDGNLGAVYNTPRYYKTAVAFGGFKDVNQAADFPAGMFEFELYTLDQDGTWTLSQTTSNGENDLAANHFRFDDILYTALGSHTYKIVERTGSMPHMDYDPTEYIIEVTVQQGELYHEHNHFMMDVHYRLFANGTEIALQDSRSLTELLTNISFSNHYFLPVDVPIQAVKTLDGRAPGSRIPFRFTLATAEGNVINTVTNNGSMVDFGLFRFEEAGTYQFILREEADPRRAGSIEYDKSVYTVTVDVFEQPTNGHYEGQLGAKTTFRRNQAVWTEAQPLFENQTIPPVTGDSAPIGLMALLMLISSSGLFLLLRRRHS